MVGIILCKSVCLTCKRLSSCLTNSRYNNDYLFCRDKDDCSSYLDMNDAVKDCRLWCEAVDYDLCKGTIDCVVIM